MHLQTTKCCNHIFTSSDIIAPLMSQEQALGTNDVHLYGGHAKRFAKTKCPECGKEYIMWLKPKSGTYKVLTISEAKKQKIKRKAV